MELWRLLRPTKRFDFGRGRPDGFYMSVKERIMKMKKMAMVKRAAVVCGSAMERMEFLGRSFVRHRSAFCFALVWCLFFLNGGCGDSGSGDKVDAHVPDDGDTEWMDSSPQPDDARVDGGVIGSCIQDLCVDPESGDDEDGDGSAQNPYRTITRALQDASSGMSIGVWPGKLDISNGEEFPLNLPGDMVLIAIVPSEDANIVGGSPAIDMGGGDVVRGFTIKPVGAAIRISRPGNVLLENNVIQAASLPGVEIEMSEVVLTADSNWFVGSVFGGTAIDARQGATLVLDGNAYSGDFGYGVRVGDGGVAEFASEYFLGIGTAIEATGDVEVVVRNSTMELGSFGFVAGEGTENALLDLGTVDNPGGNFLVRNDNADLCVISEAVVYAVGNTWDNDPPEQGVECEGGIDIGVVSGGNVILE